MKKLIDKYLSDNLITKNNSETVRSHLIEAYKFAKEHSDDESTWTGAVIVKDGTKISEGANQLSPNVKITDKRMERPLKYEFINHAERSAIFSAAKEGKETKGAVMYMPWIPCMNCANGIIMSGISKLVMHYEMMIMTPDDWEDNVNEAFLMLKEAGVALELFKGKLDETDTLEHLFRGEIWKP